MNGVPITDPREIVSILPYPISSLTVQTSTSGDTPLSPTQVGFSPTPISSESLRSVSLQPLSAYPPSSRAISYPPPVGAYPAAAYPATVGYVAAPQRSIAYPINPAAYPVPPLTTVAPLAAVAPLGYPTSINPVTYPGGTVLVEKKQEFIDPPAKLIVNVKNVVVGYITPGDTIKVVDPNSIK